LLRTQSAASAAKFIRGLFAAKLKSNYKLPQIRSQVGERRSPYIACFEHVDNLGAYNGVKRNRWIKWSAYLRLKGHEVTFVAQHLEGEITRKACPVFRKCEMLFLKRCGAN
jgi:hypothetical protein